MKIRPIELPTRIDVNKREKKVLRIITRFLTSATKMENCQVAEIK